MDRCWSGHRHLTHHGIIIGMHADRMFVRQLELACLLEAWIKTHAVWLITECTGSCGLNSNGAAVPFLSFDRWMDGQSDSQTDASL